MKPYPVYKNYGIEWIGKIPKEWGISKIKHILMLLYKSKLEAAEGKEEGLYPFFTSSRKQNKFIDFAIFDDFILDFVNKGRICTVSRDNKTFKRTFWNKFYRGR
ncbi:MAG: hypothetical protein M1407_04365 [Deltaproteobacteria bacterium]|nr:hypothetical protein [Deltaproteobacteria bacterium]